jgi:GTPase
VRLFYSLLPQRHRWVEAQQQAAVFIIDETFAVPGVGTVVAGGLVWLAGGLVGWLAVCFIVNKF